MIPVALASDERLPAFVAALPPVHEVIVVVGPDQDVTRVPARSARVIRQTRTGYGNALACGVAAATGEVIVTVPGDGSGDPADLPRLVAALRAGADVAEAIRPAGWLGLVLLWFMNVLLGCRPAGTATGYRAFWRRDTGRLGLPRVAGTEPVRGDGPDGGPLITIRARAAGLRVSEMPVDGRPRADLVAGLRAVTGEWRARRRDRRPSTVESILVVTGGPSRPIPTPIIAGSGTADGPPAGEQWLSDFRASRAPVNVPRGAAADRYLFEQARQRWPAPERATAARLDHLNGTAPGSRPAGDIHERRRWRANRGDHGNTRPRTQGRPNLRVINGEGGDSGGGRGHLRSV